MKSKRQNTGLLGEELRRLRTEADVTQEGLGQLIAYSASTVAMVERGERNPRRDFVIRCDEALNARGLLVRIYEAMREQALFPWFREWAATEGEAVRICSFEPMVIPGLLQTEAYARALLAGASQLSDDEIEEQVSVRIDRQSVLSRNPPPQACFVMDEGVLHRPIGGPKVMSAQLLRLAHVGSMKHVHIQIVPISVGSYPGLNGSFVIATPAQGMDVAYLDHPLEGTIVDRPSDVLSLQRAWESVRADALSARQSVDMITEAAKRWT